MAGYMGDDDDDAGMGLQMIPKPGTQVAGQQLPPQQDPNAVNMRPVLAQAGSDRRNAQQGWEDALRKNVGVPVENAGHAAMDSLDQMFNGMRQKPQQQQAPPSQQGPNADQMDALRNSMLAQRAQQGGSLSPQDMERFQRIKAAMMGGPAAPGQPPQPMIAGKPEDTQED